MITKHSILASIFFLITIISFGNEGDIKLDLNDEKEEIFTSKDKDFLQQWHYQQILKMEITENERDEYFSRLNQFTYKMSRLGLPKYYYTDAERKHEFERLVAKLDAAMKNSLSPSNYIIHHESFDRIEDIVYEKRNWDE